jgi:hypothetical protein
MSKIDIKFNVIVKKEAVLPNHLKKYVGEVFGVIEILANGDFLATPDGRTVETLRCSNVYLHNAEIE